MRKHKTVILIALLTLALGRVIHEPFFTAAPAAEKEKEEVTLSHSQAEAIQRIVFPTTQDDGEGIAWFASNQPTTIDAAPASVPAVATTQPAVAPVAMLWTIETQSPTYVVSESQAAPVRHDSFNDPIALVEDMPGNPVPSDDFETLSSGEGRSSTSSGSAVITLPPEPIAVISSPPPALNLGTNPLLDQTSNNSGNPGAAAPSQTPEPVSFFFLIALLFTKETRRTRRNSTGK
ncbi:MAG TPA: hypothetical protein VHS31_18395 [Tepidisphaeraceae bacterium]|jgi:hypothetical protein|nr:hypothetical protein [Tepidisphaeraceae bacterium]